MIPVDHVVILTVILFCIGIVGVLTRRNVVVVFMSVEIMLNSVNLLFIAFARMWNNIHGEIFVLFVMAVAAAEAAIGLALVIALHRNFKTVDLSHVSELKE